jgi:hypothetical protein
MKVKLSYFKKNGKWFSDASYDTSEKLLFKIWKEVRFKREIGDLPDLVKGGGSEFLILVIVPEHKHNHPHLIV